MNLFTKGLLASALVGMMCVAASADEVKVEIPNATNVTMTIKASSIDKVSDIDGKEAFAVIHLPLLKFSSPLILNGVKYERSRFYGTVANANVLCNVFGFGAYLPTQASETAANKHSCETLAEFKGDSREIVFTNCYRDQSYWLRIACASR